MTKMRSFRYFWALVLAAGVACSVAQDKPEIMRSKDGFKVSVTSAGKEVSNFEAPLVHRVALSPLDVKRLRGPGNKVNLPFSYRPEFDGVGKPLGVKVLQVDSTPGKPKLGVKQGDILTAVNMRHTFSGDDFNALLSSLNRSGEASLTLLRKGQPHKILYSVLPKT